MADSRAQQNWASCTQRNHAQDGINARRVQEHEAKYVKPRPADWWTWHCDACNAPHSPDPERT